MAHLDLAERLQPRVSTQMLLGAASPLWGYFGVAAAGGVAFWWMTRWTQPANLEAMLEGTLAPVRRDLPQRAAEAMIAPDKAMESLVAEGVEAALEPVAAAEGAMDDAAPEHAPAAVALEPEPALEAPSFAEAERALDQAEPDEAAGAGRSRSRKGTAPLSTPEA